MVLAAALTALGWGVDLDGGLVLRQRRADRDPLAAFLPQIAALGASLAVIAIVWQSAPFMVGR